MFWYPEICMPYLFRAIGRLCIVFFVTSKGYSVAIALGNLFYKCSYELFYEYRNITLGFNVLRGVLCTLLQHKLYENICQTLYFFGVLMLLLTTELGETIWNSDCGIVFIITIVMLVASSVSNPQDTYKHFIRYSGLDCGSFMAYSFFHGYIKYVVASSADTSSKDLVERMTDYEAVHDVTFPIKKLLILQPHSMHIPPKFQNKLLENASNMEEVVINRGGVVNRRYQLSVYKIVGLDWYVNVQGASPLITYYEESERSELLAKYKKEVGKSFRKHLKKLISDDPSCKGMVEIIDYNDCEEIEGKPVDVSSIIKNHIEAYLKKNS